MASPLPKTPVYFLSHGGPNLIEEPDHPAYSKLQEIGKEVTSKIKPKAVVIFSAHWQGQNDRVLVNTAEISDLIYDFYGFPDWYYSVKYPHVGSRDVAQNVMSKLEDAGIAYAPVERGLDHGAWLPLLIAFDPEKNPLNVPIVQVSLFKNENPDEHYHLGEAVSALREENILVLASGMAVHNLRDLWNSMGQDQPMPYVSSFDGALRDAATTEPSQRKMKMAELLKRGDARQAHPSFDHLLPIHIAAGAAGNDAGTRLFTMAEGSMSWAQYRFGDVTGNGTLAARL
ncbi:Extradiol ring-cleavage dioxygenase class III enzyme subunit B [Neofusicoccum parvum]|uniref:Extradiol ring-cleavage dioxygenase class III enzyme subunit B n=1 Tax=Neofusicoccum parvum TaxID=310453 RepID=A0ACB5S8I4_9PEZI|nr:Extradiol ring-cleavage dioxygenase class III enzyme subunit B [Neofusicoccum parvum]GME50194.1 Extradiol ring-cleavage dioxygenase class III enzyme subunit B [Neofusicoccum parvum]